MQNYYNTLADYFIRGDVAGAIAFMKGIPELSDFVQPYIDLFEKKQYIRYDIPENLNRILLCYQHYFRDVFYLHKENAEDELLEKLKIELGLPDGDASAVEEEMTRRFTEQGYQLLCGITNGYRGPYVWKETVPMTFEVELPETISTYRVNMLRGFVMRSWMDYLTFGMKGTGGWTAPDGTICCVENAYDITSEQFQVSLLKHEAQHAEDYKRWPNIQPHQLEYRAKLVELIYAKETNLLEKFCREAVAERMDDSHAIAAVRIKREMGELVSADNAVIQARARALFAASSREMDNIYRYA